jgi:hypothetical protein
MRSSARCTVSAQCGTLVVRGEVLVADRKQVSLAVSGAAPGVTGRRASDGWRRLGSELVGRGESQA